MPSCFPLAEPARYVHASHGARVRLPDVESFPTEDGFHYERLDGFLLVPPAPAPAAAPKTRSSSCAPPWLKCLAGECAD